MLKPVLVVLVVLAAVVVAIGAYGNWRWEAGTRALLAKLEATRVQAAPRAYRETDPEGLPAPVQRYLRLVLKGDQPLVLTVDIRHSGTFNAGESGEQWSPFTSVQRVVTRRPGFVWDARIAMFPGVAVRVHDAFVAGEGLLHASAMGLFTVADLRGTPEVAQGELMRFAAETAWYPTALLPSEGARWESVDDRSAKLTLRDGPTSVTLLFRFDAQGLVASVRSESRQRAVAGGSVATPWEGRWSDYELREGMLVPMRGEVAWMLPEGPKPYWRGQVTGIGYEFAR
jgi:hypothetical protein